MRQLLREAGLEEAVDVDSAGTAAYHAGEPPDARATAIARKRGIELGGLARKFERRDWERFDYVLALDRENYEDLRESAPNPKLLGKLHLLRSFDPDSPKHANVPDPYYGGDAGFEEVLDLCEAACRGLIAHLREQHEL